MGSDKESEDLKPVFSVCMICYNNSINEVNSSINEKIKTSFKLLFRQLKLETNVGLDGVEACVDCSSLLESYGEIYHQWKLLELQLQWRISEISNIIRIAGRIPKRVEAFKSWCNYQDKSKKLKTGLGSDFRELRSRLKLECMNPSQTLPHLRLSRVDHEIARRSTQNYERKALFLGWFTSSIAVAALSDFNNLTAITGDKHPVDLPVETGPAPAGGKKIIFKCYKCGSLFINYYYLGRHRRMNGGCPMKIAHPRWKPTKQLYVQKQLLHTQNRFSPVISNSAERFHYNIVRGKQSSKKHLVNHLKNSHVITSNAAVTGSQSLERSTGSVDARAHRTIIVPKSDKHWRCDICGRRFTEKSSLDRHLKRNSCPPTHREVFNFPCQFCSQEFSGKFSLQRHLASGHRFHHENAREFQHLKQGQAPGIYFCPFCGTMETTGRSGMINHLRMEHIEEFEKRLQRNAGGPSCMVPHDSGCIISTFLQ